MRQSLIRIWVGSYAKLRIRKLVKQAEQDYFFKTRLLHDHDYNTTSLCIAQKKSPLRPLG